MALITSDRFYFNNLDELKSNMLHYFAGNGHKIDWTDGQTRDQSHLFETKNPYVKAPYGLDFWCKNSDCNFMIICEIFEERGVWQLKSTVVGGYVKDKCESKISRLMR